MSAVLICKGFLKHLNSSTLSKDVSLCCGIAFWSEALPYYLVSSVFTSRPVSLSATNTASGFLLDKFCVFTHYINVISVNQKLMCSKLVRDDDDDDYHY